jgi:hypothetical protein
MLFLISNSDGDTSVRMVDEGTFLAELNRGDYGPAPRFLTADELTERDDTNYWPEGSVLVIRGSLIVPAAMQVIKEWGLPK